MSKSKDARIHELEKRNAALEAEVVELKALLAQALNRIAQLEKNSRTSSKPPSSDIVKPPAPGSGGSGAGGRSRGRKKKRSIGGQKGHPRHQRPSFAQDEIDQAFAYDFAPCDAPGPGWERLPDDAIHQQVELRGDPLIITEHRLARYRHRETGRVIHAPAPQGLIEQGLLGPRLRALTATLKGELHASYRGIARLYDDALGLNISTGYLAKVVAQTAESLAHPYAELCAALPDQPVLNLDETGHPDQGGRYWLWAAIAKTFSVFRVDKSRGSKVIEDLLGLAYQGVVGSDFFSAYRKFAKDHPGCVPAYCWAHLIREVRFLATLTDKATARWANKLLDAIKRLFKAYHHQGQRAQANARQAVLTCVRRPPQRGEAQTLAKRVRQHAGAYFLFLVRDDVEPTNNIAERALRHGVMHRKLTQGTRGDTGQRWLERMLSVRATCRQQERSFFGYLVEAINAHAAARQSPALLA
jgi:transposase